MGRIEENKLQKKNSLMDTAFQLFTSQGIAKTSIADIAERAGVAKGTFYLYFKDKYDLHEKLVIHKSEQLFRHALENSGYQELEASDDRLLAIVDDILFQLQKNTRLLQFINKNLGWGIVRRAVNKSESEYIAVFEDILGHGLMDSKTMEIELYTIVELVGSACYSVILRSEPVDLESYLPYLHRSIRAILDSFHTARAAAAQRPPSPRR